MILYNRKKPFSGRFFLHKFDLNCNMWLPRRQRIHYHVVVFRIIPPLDSLSDAE
jgi:hypothetical protein